MFESGLRLMFGGPAMSAIYDAESESSELDEMITRGISICCFDTVGGALALVLGAFAPLALPALFEDAMYSFGNGFDMRVDIDCQNASSWRL